MDKETHKKLTANFPKSVVKKAPQGKYGDYVPHHIYTKRLVDVVGGKYNFTYDIIRDKDNAVVGASVGQTERSPRTPEGNQLLVFSYCLDC